MAARALRGKHGAAGNRLGRQRAIGIAAAKIARTNFPNQIAARLAVRDAHHLGDAARDAEIAEVVAHVGLNIFTNYFNNTAETDIDFPKAPALKREWATTV